MGEGADPMNRDDLTDTRGAGDIDDVRRAAESAAQRPGDETAAIREDIEQTRAEMSQTIDQIQARLDPGHIKDQVKEQVWEYYEDARDTVREATIGRVEDMVYRAGETVRETRSSIVGTIKENPIPAAMVGLGLGWLYMNRSSADSYSSERRPARYASGGVGRAGYYAGEDLYETRTRPYQGAGRRIAGEPYRSEAAGREPGVLGRAQEAAGDLASRAQETAGEWAGQAQETAGYIANQARYQASRLEDRVENVMDERPMLVGALVFGIGAAIGLALPRTRKEDQLMGEVRDGLVEKAQEAAQDALQQVQKVAGDTPGQAGRPGGIGSGVPESYGGTTGTTGTSSGGGITGSGNVSGFDRKL
jgi:hypothetical protein